jgi:HSP20 family protein
MARTNVMVRKVGAILPEIEALQQRIRQRAYDVFRRRGEAWGGAFSDWLTAERELVWKPAVALREKDDQFEVLAAVPGVEATDLVVHVTPGDVLIQADVNHRHAPDKGVVHLCEFEGGRLFRSVHFPRAIDPAGVKAEYRNGMLRLIAPVAAAVPARTVEIQAA